MFANFTEAMVAFLATPPGKGAPVLIACPCRFGGRPPFTFWGSIRERGESSSDASAMETDLVFLQTRAESGRISNE